MFLANQVNPSRALVTEVMMIPYVNIKKLWKSRSDNSRTEKDMKKRFLEVATGGVL